MTKRFCEDWLASYVEYASYTEAPKQMHFWSGVSAIAGALRRRVWIDAYYFKWYANMYIILVAPPGVVSKSTTADIAMGLLKQVHEPKIAFGPSVVTWQALVTAHAAYRETFIHPDTSELTVTSPLTIVSSELGNLLNPEDRQQVDMLVNLWDGKSFDKVTKGSGSDTVINPWLNIIAATTPDWIKGSFPKYMIGGGFTSRTIFVFADTKEKLVAYPQFSVPANSQIEEARLVNDLTHIANNLCGEYKLTPEAVEVGTAWYKKHWTEDAAQRDQTAANGTARKQSQIHKLSMILAAAKRDELIITAEDFVDANAMLTNLEFESAKVFSEIGAHDVSVEMQRFLLYIGRKGGRVKYAEGYKFLQQLIPFKNDQEQAINSVVASGQLTLEQVGMDLYLVLVVGG